MAFTFKKLIKGILVGGGSILAALCPPAGGAVITAGLAIGTGAAAAGELIKTDGPAVSVDSVAEKVNSWLSTSGLSAPVGYQTMQGTVKGIVIQPIVWVAAAGIGLILLLKKQRR